MTVLEAIARARAYIAELSGLHIDAIAKCERDGEGWKIRADVIESRARLGDDDLLATLQIGLDAKGELTGFERVARYKRTQAAAIRAV